MNLSNTHIYMFFLLFFFFFFFFLGVQFVFGLFILTPRQCFLPHFLGLLLSVYGQDMFMLLLIFIPLMVLFLLCLMYVTYAFARIFVCLPPSMCIFR